MRFCAPAAWRPRPHDGRPGRGHGHHRNAARAARAGPVLAGAVCHLHGKCAEGRPRQEPQNQAAGLPGDFPALSPDHGPGRCGDGLVGAFRCLFRGGGGDLQRQMAGPHRHVDLGFRHLPAPVLAGAAGDPAFRGSPGVGPRCRVHGEMVGAGPAVLHPGRHGGGHHGPVSPCQPSWMC